MDRVESQPSGEGNGSPPGKNPAEFRQLTEEEQIVAAEEARQRERGRTMAEFLSGKDIDPGEVWIALAHDVLLPSEKACIPLTQYEYTPYLKEALRRAGATYDTLHLEERRGVLEEKVRLMREERDQQLGLGTDEGKEKAEAITRQMNTLGERLYGKEEEVEMVNKENELEVKKTVKVKTRQGLVDRLNQRVALETGLDERKEWEQLYWKLRGSITLTEIHVQREKAMGAVEVYCEQLFLSGFYKVEMQMKEMLAILEDEEYGLEIEEAMRAYTDIHIKPYLDINNKKKVGVRVKFGEFSPEFDRALGEYLQKSGRKIKIGTDGKIDRNHQYELPKILQLSRADMAGREIDAAYVRERAARVGGRERPHVAERAEILAKRIMEFQLLTVWLSVERDENGKIKYETEDGKTKPPKIGFKRLEGGANSDLDKQFLSAIKYSHERDYHKPSGPTPWDWSKALDVFEGFSVDMLHDDAKIKLTWYDSGGKPIDQSTKEYIIRVAKDFRESSISIFDLWYWGRNNEWQLERKYRLPEIYRGGINLRPISDPKEIEVEETKKDETKGDETKKITVKATCSGRTAAFGENYFDGYHFVVYKQSKTREMALLRGGPKDGKEDCIGPLESVAALEPMTKDSKTAFDDSDKETILYWFRTNVAICRLMAWRDKAGNKKAVEKGDFLVSTDELVSETAQKLAQGMKEAEMAFIPKALGKGFLTPELAELVKARVDSLGGMYNIAEFAKEYTRIKSKSESPKDARRRLLALLQITAPFMSEGMKKTIDQLAGNLR